MIDNQVEGVETPYVLSEETRLQEETNSREENRDLEENESQEEPQNQESTEIVTNSGDVNNNTNQTTETRENTESASEEARSGEEKQTSSKSSDKLKLKLKRKKSAITLKWKRVASAKGYVIYGARKGKKQKKIKTIKKGTTTSFTHKKLKSKKTYKYVVKAYTIKKGKKKWIAISKTCYAKTK